MPEHKTCVFCGWYTDNHFKNCPHQQVADPKIMESWQKGYNDGFTSKLAGDTGDPIYLVGWNTGDMQKIKLGKK
jgi:hypothetical protein